MVVIEKKKKRKVNQTVSVYIRSVSGKRLTFSWGKNKQTRKHVGEVTLVPPTDSAEKKEMVHWGGGQ